MSLRRAVGSLLWRFSQRATPRKVVAAPARSLRDLPIADVLDGAAIFAAATLAAAGGTLALRYFTKGPGRFLVRTTTSYLSCVPAGEMIGDREEVTYNKVITRDIKKLDMKKRFEQWIMKNNKTYRDEEEKAMWFQLFKATVEWIESQPPDVQKRMFPEISYFADFIEREQQCMLTYPDKASRTMRNEMREFLKAKNEKGESLIWKSAVKQGDTRATQASS